MGNTLKTKMIENYLKEYHLSKTKFCKLCKISYCTYQKMINNQDNFQIIALFRIAKVMDVEVYQLFE